MVSAFVTDIYGKINDEGLNPYYTGRWFLLQKHKRLKKL